MSEERRYTVVVKLGGLEIDKLPGPVEVSVTTPWEANLPCDWKVEVEVVPTAAVIRCDFVEPMEALTDGASSPEIELEFIQIASTTGARGR